MQGSAESPKQTNRGKCGDTGVRVDLPLYITTTDVAEFLCACGCDFALRGIFSSSRTHRTVLWCPYNRYEYAGYNVHMTIGANINSRTMTVICYQFVNSFFLPFLWNFIQMAGTVVSLTFIVSLLNEKSGKHCPPDETPKK